jgi:hypothetical protein
MSMVAPAERLLEGKMRGLTLLTIGAALAIGATTAAHGGDAPLSAGEAWRAPSTIVPDGVVAQLRIPCDATRCAEPMAGDAADERPYAVPEAAVSGSLEDKVRAIGAEARASLEAPRDRAAARSRPWQLVNLADAQIDAGDAAGARETIAEILTLRQRRSAAEDEERRMVELWIRAGDPGAARRLAESLHNPLARVAALGELGEGLARSGDLAGARATLELVERASESPTGAARRVVAGFDGSPHDLAIRKIGDALADGGDAQGALHAATLLPQGLARAGLLADIAGKQCTGRDNAAPHTIALANSAAHAIEQAERPQAAVLLGYALATCNDAQAAVAAARDLAGDKSGSVLARVAHDLTGHGDYAHARQVDEANAEALVDVEDRVALAERQIARGDIELAKPSLAKALAMTLDAVGAKKEAGSPPYEVLEAERPLSGIVFAEIKAGVFADALASLQGFERDNRPQYAVDIIEEMAKRGDERALARMLPAMLDVIGKADSSGTAGDHLTRAAKLLAHAGYVAEARKPLAMAQELARRGVDASYAKQILRQIARAQAAMGDMDGARATVDALDLHGGQHAFLLVDLALEKGDMALALQHAAETVGIMRDQALSQIAWKQVEAGDVAGAMTTAWQIHDLGQRSEALLALLKAVGRA